MTRGGGAPAHPHAAWAFLAPRAGAAAARRLMTLLSLCRPTLQVGKQWLIKVVGLRSHLRGPAEGQEQAHQMESLREAGNIRVPLTASPGPCWCNAKQKQGSALKLQTAGTEVASFWFS